jgi:hypothetical protein
MTMLEEAKMREALEWIRDQRYKDRSTVTPERAWDAWIKSNTLLVEIFDRAAAALPENAKKTPAKPEPDGGHGVGIDNWKPIFATVTGNTE